MMIGYILMLVFALATPAQQAPQNGWDLFKAVKFKNRYFKEYSAYVPVPILDEQIKTWENKEIQLRGYIIPEIEVVESFTGIVLSRFPYSQCFFCGKAGPESVAEVQLKYPRLRPRFHPERTYIFKGKLKLNDTDLNHFNFILTEAEIVAP